MEVAASLSLAVFTVRVGPAMSVAPFVLVEVRFTALGLVAMAAAVFEQ